MAAFVCVLSCITGRASLLQLSTQYTCSSRRNGSQVMQKFDTGFLKFQFEKVCQLILNSKTATKDIKQFGYSQAFIERSNLVQHSHLIEKQRSTAVTVSKVQLTVVKQVQGLLTTPMGTNHCAVVTTCSLVLRVCSVPFSGIPTKDCACVPNTGFTGQVVLCECDYPV